MRASAGTNPFACALGQSTANSRSTETSSGEPNGTGRRSRATATAGPAMPSSRACGIADRLAHRVGSSQGAVLAALLRRERLGPTFIGDGVAMPHARLEGIAGPAVAVARLRRPVPFGSPDDAAVDLLFAVLWPKAHTKGFVPALARIWRLLRRTELAAGLRRARTAEEAHALIASAEGLPT